MKAVKVGSVVAFNNLPDATWFEVLGIDGFILTIKEKNTNYKSQTSDKSLVLQVK